MFITSLTILLAFITEFVNFVHLYIMNKLRENFILGFISATFIVIFLLSILPFLLSFLIPETSITLYTTVITLLSVFSMQVLIGVGYVFLKSRVNPQETKKELEIKLKSIKWSKNEIKKKYYNRQISEEIFKNLIQKYEEEEIRTKREIEKLK